MKTSIYLFVHYNIILIVMLSDQTLCVPLYLDVKPFKPCLPAWPPAFQPAGPPARTIGLNNVVMTHVWVSGRYAESCESVADCALLFCENKKCGCKTEMKKVTFTKMFGSTTTMCTPKDGKWY